MFYNVKLAQLKEHHILGFLETLASSELSYPTIVNYLSGLKAAFHKYQLQLALLETKNVNWMLLSMSKNLPYCPRHKGVFSIDQLVAIVRCCDSLPHPLLYRAIFLLAFHGFFRLSNLVPSSQTTFDVTRHLARGDVVSASPGMHILLKWSKTLQKSNNVKTVPLALIPNSRLCPVTALKAMMAAYPAGHNQPMFCIPKGKSITTVTQSQVRTVLAVIVKKLHLSPTQFGFHTFRRSGASLAFQNHVPLQDIQSHGTWLSQAVWSYIQPALSTTNVPTTFRHLMADY